MQLLLIRNRKLQEVIELTSMDSAFYQRLEVGHMKESVTV